MSTKEKYIITELKLENNRIKLQRPIDSVYTRVKQRTPINKIALILFSKLFIHSKSPFIKGTIVFTNGTRTYKRSVTRMILKQPDKFKLNNKTYDVVITVD